VHLVGFTVEMYQDARPYKRQSSVQSSVFLTGNIYWTVEYILDSPMLCSECDPGDHVA
jgi:hypothetical protein